MLVLVVAGGLQRPMGSILSSWLGEPIHTGSSSALCKRIAFPLGERRGGGRSSLVRMLDVRIHEVLPAERETAIWLIESQFAGIYERQGAKPSSESVVDTTEAPSIPHS
ncbi:hypothetical protein H101_08089 [Trichophyton interdigitale H6]|nr:hypothetical protein H101_08089 [Trichophyton interdigitale H6]